jgi:hypothetical protein
MRTSSFLLLGALFLSAGCDVLDEPDNPKPSDGPCAGNGSGARRVLIEDLTGFRCNNCPEAAEVAHGLQNFYCKDVIVVGMHVTETFAAPLNPPPGQYSTDFRTPAGDEYVTTPQIQPPSLPRGLVSRRVYNNSRVLQRDAWASATAAIIGQPAQFEVLIDTVIHNTVTNTYDFQVRVPVLQDVSGDHNLTVYLTEDHVADWQMDYRMSPPDVFPYDHRHVLRDNVNGTWGQPVVSGSAAAGETMTVEFSYTMADNVLVPENCSFVAYVYRTDSYEVMQVSERKIDE